MYYYMKLAICQGCYFIYLILQAKHGLWVILFDNLHKDCKKKPSSVSCPVSEEAQTEPILIMVVCAVFPSI